MIQATVSAKGRVTLPSDVRKALAIKAGDRLIFEVSGDKLTARVLHTTNIDELFDALLGVDRVGSPQEERAAFHEALIRGSRFADEPERFRKVSCHTARPLDAMKTVEVGRGGQIKLPKEISEHLGLEPGHYLGFSIKDDKVVLHPITKTLRDFRGEVKVDGPQDLEAVREKVLTERAAVRKAGLAGLVGGWEASEELVKLLGKQQRRSRKIPDLE